MENLAYFNEKEYIEAFNLGYKVSKEFPELGELIYSAKGQSTKLDGLKDGRQQYLEDQFLEKQQEQSKDKIKEQKLPWLRSPNKKDKTKETYKGKDIEPEM